MNRTSRLIAELNKELDEKTMTPFERNRTVSVINRLMCMQNLETAYKLMAEKLSEPLTCCDDCQYCKCCVNEDCVDAIETFYMNMAKGEWE